MNFDYIAHLKVIRGNIFATVSHALSPSNLGARVEESGGVF